MGLGAWLNLLWAAFETAMAEHMLNSTPLGEFLPI
jgi:hypothetical protein